MHENHSPSLQIAEWAHSCQNGLHEAIALMQTYFAEKASGESNTDYVVGRLSGMCTMTSESALLLIAHERLWDAEMLIRSALEGSYKLAFLCVPDTDERVARVREYYEYLPEMGRLRTHDRLSTLLGAVPNPDADCWRPFRDLILSDEEVARLRVQYPRKARQTLEQRWSFLPLAEALSHQSGLGGDSLLTMGYSYKLGSHLVHQDADAIQIVWEREHRPDGARNALVLGHAARELTDLFYLAYFRVLAAYSAKSLDTTRVYDSMRKFDGWLHSMSTAYDAWLTVEYGDRQ